MRRFLLAVLLGTPSASFAARAPQLFDNSRDPLPNEDFMRLSKAGYKFTPEGRLLKPETGDPVQSVEMPLILEELESRQRLEAMLRLDLIFSRFGYKDLPDEQLEEVRRIGRQSWTLLSPTLRADLRGYYSGAELEALDKGVSVIRTPRTWLPDDLAEPGPDGLPIEPERDPAAPGPSDLPPTGRPLTPADTMPVTPLPAPWAKAPAPATPPAPTTYPGPTTPPVRTQVPEPAPMALRVPPPAPMALPAAPPLAPAAPAAAAAPPAPPVPTDGTRPPNASAGPAGALGGEGEGMPAVVVSGGAQPTPEAIAALQALIRTGMSPPAPGSQSTVIRTTPPVAPAPAVAAAGAPPAPAAPAPAPARAPAPAPVAPPPPPAPVPAAPRVFAEYPVFAADTFAKFLADAPYGREAHHLIELIARHAAPEDRRSALGVLQRHLPAVLLDPAKAGTAMRAHRVLPKGELGMGKSIVVLHTGPVIARRKRLLLGSQVALVPDSKDFYQERALAVPALAATALGAASANEEEGDWGRALVFDDGSRRLRPSPEQLAGTLLEQLLLIDARARGFDDAYHSRLRARAAQLRLYRRISGETGNAPRLDRALAAEYAEWLARPLDWNDHWVHALSAPSEGVIAPSVSGELEERLRARGAAELAVLERIGLAPERTAPAPAPKADDYVEREHQARIERELKALSTASPEAKAWVAGEHAFRQELSAATH